MNYIPKIILAANPRKDAQLFWDFLTHKYYLDKRQRILTAFPELDKHTHKKNFRSVVDKFVFDYYKNHRVEIKKIVETNKDLIRRDEVKSFRLLSKLMSYKWKHQVTYRAYTTILPFSPLGDRHFFYSILRKIKHPDWKVASMLYIGMHEISHMIFFEYLEKIQSGSKIKLHKDTQHFLKEAITTALLNQRESMLVLKKKKKEPGNSEIQELYITNKNGAPQKLIDLIGKRYVYYKKKGVLFQDFLKYFVLLTHTAEQEFNKRRKMWNTHGREILTNKKLLDQYKKPIKLG